MKRLPALAWYMTPNRLLLVNVTFFVAGMATMMLMVAGKLPALAGHRDMVCLVLFVANLAQGLFTGRAWEIRRAHGLDQRKPVVIQGVQTKRSQSRDLRSFIRSCAWLIIRNADARALIGEIEAEHDDQIAGLKERPLRRGCVHLCALWALCWHLGVFKVLSSVMKLVECVFTRRA